MLENLEMAGKKAKAYMFGLMVVIEREFGKLI